MIPPNFIKNKLTYDESKNSQRIQRSHTTIYNSNIDNQKMNQERILFAQNMKQCQQIFQQKLEKQSSSTQEQHQDKKTQIFQKQEKCVGFSPKFFINSQKQIQHPIPPATQRQINQDNHLQRKIPQIKIQEIKDNIFQKKSTTSEICSVCLSPMEFNHRCDDEYGLISCPYCSDHIVRNFLNDHLIECIPYIEDQFHNLTMVQECSICMEDLNKDIQTYECSHSFHIACIDVWKGKSKECPICRKPI